MCFRLKSHYFFPPWENMGKPTCFNICHGQKHVKTTTCHVFFHGFSGFSRAFHHVFHLFPMWNHHSLIVCHRFSTIFPAHLEAAVSRNGSASAWLRLWSTWENAWKLPSKMEVSMGSYPINPLYKWRFIAKKSKYIVGKMLGKVGDLTMKMMDKMVILPRQLIGHIVIFYGDS